MIVDEKKEKIVLGVNRVVVDYFLTKEELPC